MKKKICFAITSITDNGVTRVVSILLDQINYSKYDVSVLLTRKVPQKRVLNENARIIEVKEDVGSGVIGRARNILELHHILKKEAFDVIVSLGDYAAMYVLFSCFGIHAKKIVSERNDPNREPDKKVFRRLRDIVYKGSDVIVCQTYDAAEYFSNIVKRRIVIYNPISDDLPIYTGKKRKKEIVNFCRIDKQKNLPLLIDAFSDFSKDHKEYELIIYGDGPEKNSIMEYINHSGVAKNIHLYSFCQNVHEKIQSAAMFVSSSDFEGMSNSMIEAMGMGIPVICTDCPIGGAHEVIQTGKNGILVPVRNKNAMVEAMRQISDNPEFAMELSKNAMELRSTLSKEKICDLWWRLIDE